MKELGVDEYKVAFEKRGKLYIEFGDYIVKLDNPYDYVPKTVEMVTIDGEKYIKDFAPKPNKVEQKEVMIGERSNTTKKRKKKKEK